MKSLVIIVYALVMGPQEAEVRSYTYTMPKSLDVCVEQAYIIAQNLPQFYINNQGWLTFVNMPVGFCTTEDTKPRHAEWYKQFVFVALDNAINPPSNGGVIEGLPRYPQQQSE